METDGLRLSSQALLGLELNCLPRRSVTGWQVQYASHTALRGCLAPWWGDGGNPCRGQVGAPGGALAAPRPGIDMHVSEMTVPA